MEAIARMQECHTQKIHTSVVEGLQVELVLVSAFSSRVSVTLGEVLAVGKIEVCLPFPPGKMPHVLRACKAHMPVGVDTVYLVQRPEFTRKEDSNLYVITRDDLPAVPVRASPSVLIPCRPSVAICLMKIETRQPRLR